MTWSSTQQLTVNGYQKVLNPTDNSYKTVKQLLNELPFSINPQFEHAVIGHIQHFGWTKVQRWAKLASTKNYPERYFMKILTRQRYGD